jgi:hypothetical protein
MLRNQGITVFFNNDCYMRMPNGKRLPFDETALGYFLPFDAAYDARGLQPSDIYIPLSPSGRGWLRMCANALRSSLGYSLDPVDTVHHRLCHFSFDRIAASADCTTGMDLSNITRRACDACERGGARRKAAKPVERQRVFTRFGQRVSSDQVAMPKSTPFGFENFCTFYDQATKTLGFYFTRGHTNEEIRRCHEQFEADYKEDLLWCGGHVLEWHCDNHGEFSSKSMDEYLATLGSKQTFIVPWNPQQNPAERANGIVLRPLRICLAHANCSERA